MRRTLLLSVLALAACTTRGDSGRRDSTAASRATAGAADDSLVPAVPRRKWFYRDPESGDPAVTLVFAVQVGGRQRFVLAQLRPDRGDEVVVSDSAGRIPVFDTKDSALAYRARVFPLEVSAQDSSSAESVAATYEKMLGVGGPLSFDLDAATRWAQRPEARGTDPRTLLEGWQLLAAADALPTPPQFDPMGMYALHDHVREEDRAATELALTGMKLSGIVLLDERARGPLTRTVSWPSDTIVWGAGDDARLARLMRVGVARFAARLSTDAAQRDVRATWPEPDPPRLTARFLGNGQSERADTLGYQALSTEAQLDSMARARVGGTLAPASYRGQVSDAALARYARDQKEYVAEWRDYQRIVERMEDEARRTLRLRIWVRNDGDRRADSVRVRILVPAGVTVVPSGSERFQPTTPADMPSALEYEKPGTKRPRATPRPRPSYREQGQRSMYNAAERVEPGPNGATLIEGLGFAAVGAHDGADLQAVVLRFPSWDAVRPFDLELDLTAAGAAPSTSRLHVNVGVRGR